MVAVLHGTIGIQHAAMSIYQAYHGTRADPHDCRPRYSVHRPAQRRRHGRNGPQLHEVGRATEDASRIADRASGSLPAGHHAADGTDAGGSRYRTPEGRSRKPHGSEYTPPTFPTVDATRAREIAQGLVNAQNPRIAVGRLRTPQGVKLAVELAELVGATTSTSATDGPMSFPQRHPLQGTRRGYDLRLHARSGNQRRSGLHHRAQPGDDHGAARHREDRIQRHSGRRRRRRRGGRGGGANADDHCRCRGQPAGHHRRGETPADRRQTTTDRGSHRKTRGRESGGARGRDQDGRGNASAPDGMAARSARRGSTPSCGR